jgi:putative flippase GtrA
VRLLAAARATRFIAIGVASTLAYMLLYVLLRTSLSAGAANALALGTTAVANTAANRRLTFAVRGRDHLLRQHAFGACVFLLTLGLTSTALWGLREIVPSPPRAAEAIVLAAASLTATVARYVALTVVFDGRRDFAAKQDGPRYDARAGGPASYAEGRRG